MSARRAKLSLCLVSGVAFLLAVAATAQTPDATFGGKTTMTDPD